MECKGSDPGGAGPCDYIFMLQFQTQYIIPFQMKPEACPTPCSTTPCHVLNYIHALSSPVHIVEPPNEEKRPLLLPLFKGEC